MVRNSPKPRELAQRVIKAAKDSTAAAIEACVSFAEGWSLYADGGWTDKEFLSFLTQLHAAQIGPNPETLSRDKEDRLMLGASSGTYAFMKKIGESDLFRDREIRSACVISSRGSLYELALFYDDACEKGSGSTVKKEERARGRALNLLTEHGDGLTRKLIAEARKALNKERQSHKPKEPPQPSAPAERASTVPQLLEAGAKFDEVLLTPSAQILDQIQELSFSDLEERFSFKPLLAEKAVVNVVVPGNKVAALPRLQEVLRVEKPRLYCVRPHGDKRQVLDLSEETLLFSNQPLPADARPTKDESPDEFIQRVLNEGNTSSRLHLFAQGEADGWVACVGDSASWSER
jgi:hypothetical protein